MLSLKIDEAEEILQTLLSYRRYLTNQRAYLNDKEPDGDRVPLVNESIRQLDRIIHQLDLRVAAAKDVHNA